ncbi:uncharacterized protein EDB93DRAFT_1298639 [Suillus bovinus]|uniref:uncharacterized protein n=1 Tax=Suillus bovinus TaxID=48563 RepID=UPI001B85BA9E|nr:uncharacterized protein EDB93DRAFT_1298639 [Suillus bovinus]KAG2139635.1 hypothetical protein EDB93DRAFT_1298639 [Suillus bovinus]
MDEASRSFTAGEVKFFSQCDTGSIPVIVLFTKFDYLYNVAYTQLKSMGTSWKDAKALAPKHAEESFANGPQLNFLKDVPRPPKAYVCLPSMDNEGADCGPLIEHTAAALDNEVLKQLFVSTQQTILELCMRYAIEKTLLEHLDPAETTTSGGQKAIIAKMGAWFPHISVRLSQSLEVVLINVGHLLASKCKSVDPPLSLSYVEHVVPLFADELHDDHCVEIQSRLLSVPSHSLPLENIIQLISAVVVIFEHSFYIFDKWHYIWDQQKHVPSFYVALEQYMASLHAAAVRKGVSAAVQAYEEAVATAAKRRESSYCRAKVELIKTVLEVALNNRLSRPDNAT